MVAVIQHVWYKVRNINKLISKKMKRKPEQSESEEEDISENESAEEDISENESAESEDESEMDLGASATESDEDDDDEGLANSEHEAEEEKTPKSRADIIDEKIHNKYEQLKGTRLYVRFPAKLPLDEEAFELKVKSLHPLIAKAAKPRQKHARFCLAEFNTQADRDTALKDIKASIETDDAFKGIFISLPKTESDEFINELVARKQQSLENRKTKSLLKRATKQIQRKNTFTTSIVITNLPKTASVAQVRKFFENAIDVQIKPGKGKFRDFSAATLTYPTTYDARQALKQDVTIGNKLILRFNTQQKRGPRKNLKRKVADDNTPKASKNKKAKKPISA